MSTNSLGHVVSCSPETIVVAIHNLKVFEEHKSSLQVGRYLRIAQGNNDFTIASIRNLRGVFGQDGEGNPAWQFQIECQAVGTLVGGKAFERGQRASSGADGTRICCR